MEFGDGVYEDRTVSASSGVTTVEFAHTFTYRFGVELMAQRATVVETGKAGIGYTVHPDPFGRLTPR